MIDIIKKIQLLFLCFGFALYTNAQEFTDDFFGDSSFIAKKNIATDTSNYDKKLNKNNSAISIIPPISDPTLDNSLHNHAKMSDIKIKDQQQKSVGDDEIDKNNNKSSNQHSPPILDTQSAMVPKHRDVNSKQGKSKKQEENTLPALNHDTQKTGAQETVPPMILDILKLKTPPPPPSLSLANDSKDHLEERMQNGDAKDSNGDTKEHGTKEQNAITNKTDSENKVIKNKTSDSPIPQAPASTAGPKKPMPSPSMPTGAAKPKPGTAATMPDGVVAKPHMSGAAKHMSEAGPKKPMSSPSMPTGAAKPPKPGTAATMPDGVVAKPHMSGAAKHMSEAGPKKPMSSPSMPTGAAKPPKPGTAVTMPDGVAKPHMSGAAKHMSEAGPPPPVPPPHVPKPAPAAAPPIMSTLMMSNNKAKTSVAKKSKDEAEQAFVVKGRKVYDYKNEYPSDQVYKEKYGANNQHLPVAKDKRDITRYLFAAVKNNNVNLMKTLLEQGADINIRDTNNSYTPLMYAITNHKQDVFKYLLIKGANTNVLDKSGKTLLHLSLIVNNFDAYKELIKTNINIMQKDKSGKFATDYIQDTDLLLKLIQSYGQNKGEALMDFTKVDFLAAVNMLLSDGVGDDNLEVNFIDDKGNTALFYAIKNNNLPMVNCLLAYGIDIHIKNKRKQDAFDAAFGKADIIAILETYKIKKRLDTNQKPIQFVE